MRVVTLGKLGVCGAVMATFLLEVENRRGSACSCALLAGSIWTGMRAVECNLWDGKISPERSGGENFPGRQAAQRPGVARSGPPVKIEGQKGTSGSCAGRSAAELDSVSRTWA
ncbi:hypothetical protein GCM10022140_43860 [Rhodococcus aetherivorans]